MVSNRTVSVFGGLAYAGCLPFRLARYDQLSMAVIPRSPVADIASCWVLNPKTPNPLTPIDFISLFDPKRQPGLLGHAKVNRDWQSSIAVTSSKRGSLRKPSKGVHSATRATEELPES